MNRALLTLLLVFHGAFSFPSFSSEDHHDGHHSDESHHHGGGKAIGKNKAIIDVDEEKGFKLSKEAIQTLGIKTQSLKGDKLPASALVVDRNIKGFYALREGYFKFFNLDKLRNLEPDIRVATRGVGLLRITDVYSTDESEYSHAH